MKRKYQRRRAQKGGGIASALRLLGKSTLKVLPSIGRAVATTARAIKPIAAAVAHGTRKKVPSAVKKSVSVARQGARFLTRERFSGQSREILKLNKRDLLNPLQLIGPLTEIGLGAATLARRAI